MINLKNYLEYDNKKNKFGLPLTFVQKIWFIFLANHASKMPFCKKVFVDNKNFKTYYWQIISDYLYLKFGVNIYKEKNYFRGFFLSHYVAIKNQESEGFGEDFLEEEMSFSRAVGEFLERYFLSGDFLKNVFVKTNHLKRLSFKEIESNVKLISHFHCFTDDQMIKFPEVKILDEDEFEVVRVKNLITNKLVHYPVGQIFRRNIEPLNKKKMFRTTTNGAAGGFSLDEATVSGIYELLERDAFMCHWLSKSGLTEIEFQNGDFHTLDNFKKKLSMLGFKINIFDTTTDIGIFCCVCIITNEATGGYVVAAASNLHPRIAIEKAIREGSSCVHVFENTDNVLLKKDYTPFISNHIDRTERINLSSSGNYRNQSKMLFLGKVNFKSIEEKISSIFSNKSEELKALLNILNLKGNNYNNVYVYNSSSDILQKLNFFVVKVIIPKLYPIYLEENMALPNSERLSDFNLWKNGKKDFEINTFPHPFP